jgi:hypothetical protein
MAHTPSRGAPVATTIRPWVLGHSLLTQPAETTRPWVLLQEAAARAKATRLRAIRRSKLTQPGGFNAVSGYNALLSNTTGVQNTATGPSALLTNTTGLRNTAIGAVALSGNSTGSSNIALGFNAGLNLTTGSNNIDIGAPGVAAESGNIRIGTATKQTLLPVFAEPPLQTVYQLSSVQMVSSEP